MSRRRSVEDWRRAVFASNHPQMTSSVKLLCLYLADFMNERDKKVSVPRRQVAAALGVHEQRVSERYAKAVKAEFLHPVSPGYVKHTAVYQGIWPNTPKGGESVPISRTLSKGKGTESREAFGPPKSVPTQAGELTALQDAISKSEPSIDPTEDEKRSKERGCFYCTDSTCNGECLEQQSEDTPTPAESRFIA